MTDRNQLMTVGQLAARTGLSIKAIRELEGRGLIYTAGRSPANYRLFDESALWCAQVIGNLRSLGLTIKEIEQLAGVYLDRPEEPIGPRLARLREPRDLQLAAATRRPGRMPAVLPAGSARGPTSQQVDVNRRLADSRRHDSPE